MKQHFTRAREFILPQVGNDRRRLILMREQKSGNSVHSEPKCMKGVWEIEASSSWVISLPIPDRVAG